MDNSSFTRSASRTQGRKSRRWGAGASGPDTAEVVFGPVWPRLSPGEYVSEIVKSDARPSPYPAKDHARRKRQTDPDARHMKWFLDVRVEAGTDAHTERALNFWRQEREHRSPVIFFACPFRVSRKSGKPIAPRRGEKLYDSLAVLLGRPVRAGDRINLHSFVGARVRVRVVDTSRDSDGEVRAEYVRYSVARKLVALEPIAGSRQPVAHSRHFHPEAEGDRAFTGLTFEDTARGSDGVASPIGETVQDRSAGEAYPSSPAGPTPSAEGKQIERVFGRGVMDLRRCGPCSRCGATMYAREYSGPRCVWCEC